MLELPLTKEKRTHEWNIIQNMARNNNFPNRLITNLKQQIERNKKQQQPGKKENTNKKWATFTYYNSTVRKITNFSNTQILEYPSKTTIQYHK
jgi:hypothetical protein